MPQVIVEEVIEATAAAVWESWADFGNVARFHPGIAASRLINGSAPEGVGATRQCDMSKNGKQYVRERVIRSEENRQLVIEIYEATVPIKSATATLDLFPINATRTRIRMTMDFKPGMGLLGKLMSPMMKAQFRKMLASVLKSNAAFVTRGVEVVR